MADRYWVGGSGTWNTLSTSNWSTSSGGASGASAPTLIDNVIIDTASGTGTITCTAGTCADLTVTATQSIVLGAASSTLSVYGNLTFPNSGSFNASTNSWTLTFSATLTGKTITTNGIALSSITLNGIGGGWTLGSALTIGSLRTLTLTNGSFDANNYNVTIGLFVSNNSNIRTLKMGSGTWTLTGSSLVWGSATATNFTVIPSTSTVNFNSSTAKTFQGGTGITYYNIANTGTGVLTISNSGLFNNISCIANTGITFASGSTLQSNTYTFVGTPSAPITIAPSSTTNYTLTKLGGGIVDMQNVSISRCTATPSTGTWYAGASTDGGNNTGIRFVSAPKFMQMF